MTLGIAPWASATRPAPGNWPRKNAAPANSAMARRHTARRPSPERTFLARHGLLAVRFRRMRLRARVHQGSPTLAGQARGGRQQGQRGPDHEAMSGAAPRERARECGGIGARVAMKASAENE